MNQPVHRHITIESARTDRPGGDVWRWMNYQYRTVNLNDFQGLVAILKGATAAAQIEAPDTDIRTTIKCPCCDGGTAKRISRPDPGNMQFIETPTPCDVCGQLGYLLQSVTIYEAPETGLALPDVPTPDRMREIEHGGGL